MDEHNNLSEGISNYAREEERKGYAENTPLFKKIDSEEFKDLYDTRKLFLGIQRHLFLLISCMAIFGLLGGLASYKFLTTYKAEAVVLFKEEPRSSTSIEGGFTLSNLSLGTVLEMIKSPKHFEAVKAMLGLDLEPAAIEGMVDIPVPGSNSNLIRIVAKGDNPNLVVDISNTLARVAVQTSQVFTRKQLKIALDGYRAQLAVLRQTLASEIQQIEDYKVTHQYFGMDPQYSALLSQVEQARQNETQAILDHSRALIEYENLKKEVELLPEYVPISMTSQENPLQRRIVNLETTLAEARAKYTETNPKLKQLEEELSELHRKSKSEWKNAENEQFYEKNELKERIELELMRLQGKVRSSQKVKESLSEKVKEMEKGLKQLPEQQMAFVKLLQAQQITEGQLKDINKAVEAAQLLINTPRGSIDLYQLAGEAKPWKDCLWVDLLPLLGLFFGFGVGVFLSVFLETRDNKMRTSKQIEMSYSIPCIGEIPELVALNKGNGEKRTLFFVRDLVERLDKAFMRRGIEGHTSLAITSSIHGEGKSCLSHYLAHYYAQMDKKVLLLELDYRKNPFAEESQNQKATLIDYLKGDISIEEVTIRGRPDRIRITKNDPSLKELIKSKKMGNFWGSLKEAYDLIIIDTPGAIEDDYTTNLASMADLCVLVVGSSQVKKNAIDETLKVLEFSGARPCGIVLNRINPIYVSNDRIKLEAKRSNKAFLRELLTWRR